MGLDATVYRSRKHLDLGADVEFVRVISETGEVYFEDDEVSRKHRNKLVAAKLRLGNISAISELRAEMVKLTGQAGILYEKVLYSGSHSGDIVGLDELPLISTEIASIRKMGKLSTDLDRFLEQMEELIGAANYEGNPIVFT